MYFVMLLPGKALYNKQLCRAKQRITCNAIKVAHRYAVQEGDATMFHMAASLPGQKVF